MQTSQKYLSNYAEPIVSEVADITLPVFNYALVIPCYDESTRFAQHLMQSPLWDKNILTLVIINQPNTTRKLHPNNKKLLAYFAQFPLILSTPNINIYQPQNAGSAWLVVNACTGLAPNQKQGVGVARKLGCDIALALWHQQKILSPWLHNTDADTQLPSDYFDLPDPKISHTPTGQRGKYSGAVYRFKHIQADSSDKLFHATKLYEQAIKYFAASLHWAGSPYGFTALGSALSVTFESYSQVRGFPKRAAGEDFYLLNKLAKVGAIYTAKQTVDIRARPSQRVPFGTGPAAESILELNHNNQPYCYYNPQCFIALKEWLDHAASIWRKQAPLAPLSKPTTNALQAIGINELLEHLERQVKSKDQAIKTIHDWFDGFKTLKFIHYLQNNHYLAMPIEDCLNNANYKGLS